MLSPEELSRYLSELPKDLTLKINDKEYKVNKDLSSSLSNYLSKRINENPKENSVLIDYQDLGNVFPIIISFLNGKKIDINPDNDFYLDKFADFLEIEILKKQTTESLQSPLSINNIVQRIFFSSNSIPDDLIEFFENNVESIINHHTNKKSKSNQIFELDPKFLSQIIHSEKSKFASESSRYLFALNCYHAIFLKQKNPEQLNLIISESDISKIPDDVIRQLTNEKYCVLDSHFPSILLAQKIVKDILSLQSQLKDTRDQFLMQEKELKEIREENKRVMKAKSLSDSELNEVGQRRCKMAEDLIDSADKISNNEQNLTRFIVYNSIMDEIRSNLESLKPKCENLKRILIKISGTKIIYADLRSKGFKLTEQFESMLISLNGMMNVLVPNEDDMAELIEEFQQISKKLNSMADQLIKLENDDVE